MNDPGFDEVHVVELRVAGIDVHNLQMTVRLRLRAPRQALPVAIIRTFPTNPSGSRDIVGWLGEHKVAAATMECTGIYWESPFRALQEAGIRARLVHAASSRNSGGQDSRNHGGSRHTQLGRFNFWWRRPRTGSREREVDVYGEKKRRDVRLLPEGGVPQQRIEQQLGGRIKQRLSRIFRWAIA